MDKIKLLLCSIGDPNNPKTWSGTPYNLYNALKEKCEIESLNSDFIQNHFLKLLIKLVSILNYGFSRGLERGFFFRSYNALIMYLRLKTKKSNHILHTGTLDAPFISSKGKKHYLFCDSTWNIYTKYSTDINKYSKRLINVAEKLEKKCYLQFSHIFSISEHVKNNLIEHYKIEENKITVVGTGLGVIKPYFGKKDYNNGKILFAAKGRFKEKGGYLVLEAFKIAQRKMQNIHLTIVGKNDYKDLNIENTGITALGFIPVSDLQEIFNSHSLFVMPAQYEPWGLVYLEALACKMPIIGLNRNSFPEISGNGKYGFVLQDNDPDELAKIFIYAFSNPDILEEKGINGQKFCLDNFTWEKTANKIIETIKEKYI